MPFSYALIVLFHHEVYFSVLLFVSCAPLSGVSLVNHFVTFFLLPDTMSLFCIRCTCIIKFTQSTSICLIYFWSFVYNCTVVEYIFSHPSCILLYCPTVSLRTSSATLLRLCYTLVFSIYLFNFSLCLHSKLHFITTFLLRCINLRTSLEVSCLHPKNYNSFFVLFF